MVINSIKTSKINKKYIRIIKKQKNSTVPNLKPGPHLSYSHVYLQGLANIYWIFEWVMQPFLHLLYIAPWIFHFPCFPYFQLYFECTPDIFTPVTKKKKVHLWLTMAKGSSKNSVWHLMPFMIRPYLPFQPHLPLFSFTLLFLATINC